MINSLFLGGFLKKKNTEGYFSLLTVSSVPNSHGTLKEQKVARLELMSVFMELEGSIYSEHFCKWASLKDSIPLLTNVFLVASYSPLAFILLFNMKRCSQASGIWYWTRSSFRWRWGEGVGEMLIWANSQSLSCQGTPLDPEKSQHSVIWEDSWSFSDSFLSLTHFHNFSANLVSQANSCSLRAWFEEQTHPYLQVNGTLNKLFAPSSSRPKEIAQAPVILSLFPSR